MSGIGLSYLASLSLHDTVRGANSRARAQGSASLVDGETGIIRHVSTDSSYHLEACLQGSGKANHG